MLEIETNPQLRRAVTQIRAVLAKSYVPEDAGHAENTLFWMRRLCPTAGPALQLAALAHDIERARPDRLQRHAFPDYDAFKQAHAELGAQIADSLLAGAGVSYEIREQVSMLVRRHETGGDPQSDLLKDADSLSYFDHNLPLYFAREGYEETLRRARWGYVRLSARARSAYVGMRHDDAELNRLLKEAAQAQGPMISTTSPVG